VSGGDGRPAGSLANRVLHLGAGVWKPLAVNGISFETQLFRSRTTGEGGEGHVFRANVDRYAGDGLVGWHLRYGEVSPDYTARLAFVPERGLRSVGGWMDQGWQVNRGGIRRWEYWAEFDHTSHWDRSLWHRGISSGASVSFNNDTRAGISFNAGDRDEFRDRTVGASFNWKVSDIYRSGVAEVRSGRVAGGPYTFARAYQGIQVSERVSGSVEGSMLRLRGSGEHFTTDRVILGGLYEFSSERSLAARLILGSEDHLVIGDPATTGPGERRSLRNAYAAFRQELRKGADIFVLAGDPNTEGIRSQVAVKYVVTY